MSLIHSSIKASDSSGVAARREEAGTGIIVIPTTIFVNKLDRDKIEIENGRTVLNVKERPSCGMQGLRNSCV